MAARTSITVLTRLSKCVNLQSQSLSRVGRLVLACPSRTLTDLRAPPGIEEPPIPAYEARLNEKIGVKRARLLYQSRKRGMTENGLLLSTFAAKFLDGFSEEELNVYDKLINQPSNDWEIYYWVTGAKPTPLEFESDVMSLLKDHAKNANKDCRSTQPDLY
ncbi:succinate dehydrogenase assembly factor 2, mitochondrial-like [Liolophura sinensis]|uniref:succinate dehydrogenase assembly factor 2, mitochondrial-like n=1 Tax=Liolophura sinensis TaxID=3198878 RepID=UPI003158D6EE